MNKLISFWILLISILTVKGQNDPIPAATSCFFIQNATVITHPGSESANTSIIIRDGIIEDLGPNVLPPFDAKIIKADSLYVYAGFIDAYSQVSLSKDEKEKVDKDKPSSPGVATLEQAGITPQNKVTDLLEKEDKAFEALRKEGFVIAHIVPEGYIIPGQGSIISLKETSVVDDLILQKDVSMAISLNTKRGVFPSTLIGAMSRLRELDKNTDLYINNKSIFNQNPVGKARPKFVKEYESFSKVTQDKMPVYFDAKKPKNIHRALTLQKELDFNLVLTNVKLITPILDIVPINTPIILSLDIPKELKKDKKKEDKKDKEELSEEQKALHIKKEKSYEEYLSQASILAKENRTISFSSEGVKSSEIHKNIRRLIKSGLTEKEALAALTTYPSAMLGIEKIAGTIEKGKMGSLVITDKPIFEEKSSIKYVLVEGQLNKYEKEEEKKKKSDNKLGDLSGTWTYHVEMLDEEQDGYFYIEKEGENYSIEVESNNSPDEKIQAYDVEINGDEISFNIDLLDNDPPLKLSISITFINDEKFEGKISAPEIGSFPINGDKKSSPDKN